jgi:hypothetical protein
MKAKKAAAFDEGRGWRYQHSAKGRSHNSEIATLCRNVTAPAL